MDQQRFGDALQQRVPEFLPFNRPILAGIEKFHKSVPGEQFKDQGHETISQSPSGWRLHVGIKSIEHGVQFFRLSTPKLAVQGRYNPVNCAKNIEKLDCPLTVQ